MADKKPKVQIIVKEYDDLTKEIPALRGFQHKETNKKTVKDFFSHIIEWAIENNLILLSSSDGFYVFGKKPVEENPDSGSKKK